MQVSRRTILRRLCAAGAILAVAACGHRTATSFAQCEGTTRYAGFQNYRQICSAPTACSPVSSLPTGTPKPYCDDESEATYYSAEDGPIWTYACCGSTGPSGPCQFDNFVCPHITLYTSSSCSTVCGIMTPEWYCTASPPGPFVPGCPVNP